MVFVVPLACVARDLCMTHTGVVVFSWNQAAVAAIESLGPPVDVSSFGVYPPHWLPASAINAIVARETQAERRDTKQLMADHLKLQGKLDMYKQQLRTVTRDLALVSKGGEATGQRASVRARANSGGGLRRRVHHLQDLLEVRHHCGACWFSCGLGAGAGVCVVLCCVVLCCVVLCCVVRQHIYVCVTGRVCCCALLACGRVCVGNTGAGEERTCAHPARGVDQRYNQHKSVVAGPVGAATAEGNAD